MGYNTKPNPMGGRIRTFSPDDTDTCFYMNSYEAVTASEILERAREKWPGIQDDEIYIKAEHINTDCVGYDLYDPTDYTDYLCIEATKEYFERT